VRGDARVDLTTAKARKTRRIDMELRARKRATGKTTITLLVVAGLAVVGGGAARAATRGTESRTSLEARPAARGNSQLQVVLDTSASVPARYRLEALSALADVVEAWPRPVPASGKSPTQPGLIVQVRGVSADSYSPENLLGTWNVEGIPGVLALPATVTSDFTERVLTYKNEHQAAAMSYKRAAVEARHAAAGLRRLRPQTTYASEIEGAVSAAAQSFSPGGSHKLLVVSDLAQNRPLEIAGTLSGDEVLIAHLCWRATACASQERVWRKRLHGLGAASVTFVRIERFPSAVATFVTEA
jgi:hypothetical protein